MSLFQKRLEDLIDGAEVDQKAVLRRLMTHGGGLQNLLSNLIICLEETSVGEPKPKRWNECGVERVNYHTELVVNKLRETLEIYMSRHDEEKAQMHAEWSMDRLRDAIVNELKKASLLSTPATLSEIISKKFADSSVFYPYPNEGDIYD